MAAAYVSVGNIHDLCLSGQIYRGQYPWTSAFTFRPNPFKDLSWSSGLSKALKAERCGCYSRGVSAVNESSKLNISIRAVSSSTKYYDFTVIGSGVAGLRYALEVAKQGTVAVITKDEPHEMTRVTQTMLKVVLVQCYALWILSKVICRTQWSLVLIFVMKKSLRRTSHGLELSQARLKNLLSFLELLTFVLQHVYGFRCDEQFHKLVILYCKQIKSKSNY